MNWDPALKATALTRDHGCAEIDRFRALCRDVRSAHFKSSAPVVTVVPSDLIDGNLLAMAGASKRKSSKPLESFGGARRKKCHWKDVSE